MTPGIALLYLTVHASMLLYAASLALTLTAKLPFARWCSTLGCVLLFIHVGLAFHIVHHWDHADVIRKTAEQTEAVTGIRAGAGVYLNYVFMLAWLADVAFWWRIGHARYHRRSLAITMAFHGFLLFIAFNATVVFGSPLTRWTSIFVFAGLAMLGLRTAWNRRSSVSAQRRLYEAS